MRNEEDMPADPGVPSFVVHEVGVGACMVIDEDGARAGRLMRLYLREGPLDLVMSDELAAMVSPQLVEPLDAGAPVIVAAGTTSAA